MCGLKPGGFMTMHGIRISLLSLLAAVAASAQDRTWTGGGADKNWSTTANWSGAVTNPYPNRVIFSTADVSSNVFKILDQSWSVGGLQAINTSGQHLLDLNGNTLSIVTNNIGTSGDLYVKRASGVNAYLAVSNGTISVGRDILVTLGDLNLRGATLTGPIRNIQLGETGAGGTESLDLRGASIAGGILTLQDLYVGMRNNNGYLYMDNTTGINTLKVTRTFSIAQNQGSSSRIGWPDPARANTWYLPVGLDIVVGNTEAGASGRGQLWIGTTPGDYGSTDGRMIVDTNGTFNGWLSELQVGA
jgi:hypothetical protein